jgi:C1A family cysteine protease
MLFILKAILLSALSVSAFERYSLLPRFTEWYKNFRIEFRDDAHYETVYNQWLNNDDFISRVNTKNLTYQLGHNAFSGMSLEEFSATYLWDSRVRDSNGRFYDSPYSTAPPLVELAKDLSLPTTVDWTKKGATTGVKDQGQCGSCWSFSTTGALEGAYYIKTGILESFSEQQLVDCDTLRNGGKDHGCKGGLMDNAFAWINGNGGLCSEAAYPYVSGTTMTGGTCQTSCKTVDKSEIKTFVDVNPNSDNAMMAALAQQPVAIAIEADQREFQLYKSGVFTGACGTTLDHGVLAVGYGSTADGLQYYIVKNSWGQSWGSNGYILLGRGTNPETDLPYNKGAGQCGMLMEGSYPVL